MCPVIHRVDMPLITCTMVGGIHNTVDDRVAHKHIRRGHIYLGTKYIGTIGKLAILHTLKESKVLFWGGVAIRALCTSSGRSPFLSSNLFRSLFVHIGFPLFYKHYSPVIQLLEIVRSIALLVPLIT